MKGAFCDPTAGNNGFAYKLKDGKLYSSENGFKAVDKEYGRGLGVGDIIFVELDLADDPAIAGNKQVGKLWYGIVAYSKEENKGRRILKKKQKAKEIRMEFAVAFTVDAFAEYRLAIAIDRRESFQLVIE